MCGIEDLKVGRSRSIPWRGRMEPLMVPSDDGMEQRDCSLHSLVVMMANVAQFANKIRI